MRRAILPLMFILLCSIAYADFYANHEVIKDEISPFGTAEFSLNIINNQPYPDTYMIASSDVIWNVQTSPLTDYMSGMDVGKGDLETTKLLLKPNINIEEGNYFVEIEIVSQTNGEKVNDVFEVVIDPKIIDYPVLIFVEILEPTKIDPRRPASLKIKLVNENPIYITDAKVKLTSKLVNQEASVDIAPKSEKIVQFAVSFDETIAQQKDMLKVVVSRGNETIAQTQKEIEISRYIKPYKTEIERKNKFLKTIETITFTNIESVEKEQTAMVKVSGLSKAFTETIPQANIEEFDNENYFVWGEISLKSGETFTATATTSYRTVALFIFVLVIVLSSYYLFRSPIVMTKRAEKIKTKDGGISELKIVLEIKNRSNKLIKNVKIMDRLPSLSGISEDFGPETPEPKIKRHGTQGFVLFWEDLYLEAGEERIFSYKIESKLPIVGKVELKPVVAEFGPDKKRTASNPFNIYAE